MKKFISVLLALTMIFGVFTIAFAENQTTVPEGYIGIYTAEDLNNIRNNLSGKYILMNDIDLSVYENWEPIGDYDNRFCGEFDGNGYSVTGLKINIIDEEINFIGLFGSATKATFKNLAVIDCDINVNTKTDKYLGMSIAPVVGCVNSKESVISNCYSSGNINIISDHRVEVGGITGFSAGKILDCKNETDVSVNCTNNTMSYIFAGGIAGELSGELERSANTGNLTVNHQTKNGWSVVGGIVGYREHGKVKDSYNIGNISVTDTYHATVGGIYGYSGMVINCYNIGNIEIDAPRKQIGGGAGAVMFWPVQMGDAPEPEHIGEIRNCYYIDSITNTSNYTDSEFVSNYTAITAEEFSKQETFIGFDFENIWEMSSEENRPVLKGEYKKAENTPPEKTEKCFILKLFSYISNLIKRIFEFVNIFS